MKRILTSVVLLAAVTYAQTGCMCVHAVKTAGTHRRHLSATAVWTNTTGNIAIECKMADTMVLSQRSEPLGTRFVFAAPETWERAISSEIKKQEHYARRRDKTRRIDHIYLRATVALSVTNETEVCKGGFVLFPPDVSSRCDAPPLDAAWSRCAIPPDSGNTPRFDAAVSNQPVTVYIGTVALPRDAQQYKDWWWGPNQVLLIPAYAVDIVTSPIQFIMIMNALSKIDG